MKAFIIVLTSYLSLLPLASAANRPKFLPGDIILSPMNCYLCKVIEKTTNSIYSHLFVYIDNNKFAHALTKVENISFSEIKKMVDKSRPSVHLRHIESDRFSGKQLEKFFKNHFENLSYDPAFLWDNTDSRGRETLYCSEFVAKLLDRAFGVKLETAPMEYNEFREFWRSYFNGNIPDGLPGITPSFFERSREFRVVNKIYF